jgi:hypothetical protein
VGLGGERADDLWRAFCDLVPPEHRPKNVETLNV